MSLALHLRPSVHHVLLHLNLRLQLRLLLHELSLRHTWRHRVLGVRGLAGEEFVLTLYFAVDLVFLGSRALRLGKLNLEGLNIMRGNLDILRGSFAQLELLGLLRDLSSLGLEELLLVVLTLSQLLVL